MPMQSKVSFLVLLLLSCAACTANDDDLADLLEDAVSQSMQCNSLLHAYELIEAKDCFEDMYQNADHALVKATARQGSAYSYQRLGESMKAIEFMQEAIRLAHPYDEAALLMARLLAGYSSLLLVHEQYELAERYLHNAKEYYETYVEVIGSDHPQTGFLVYDVLASLYLHVDQPSEVRNFAKRAIDKADAMPGVDPNTTYLTLAKSERADSNVNAALRYSSKICESGGDHPAIAEGCVLLAALLKDEGQLSEALDALSKAREKALVARWDVSDLELEIQRLSDDIGSVW
jgi:tetratricopeptide (TPR) repeat protein